MINAKKGERVGGCLVLLVHQATGDDIVQALFLPGEGDNDEPDKEGEDREHFGEKAESRPRKRDPVSSQICHCDTYRNFSEGGLVLRALENCII